MTSRVVPFRWLAGLSCGAGATTLRTATLALIHSTAECCASTAFLRRISHTRPTDLTINHTLRTVTGCLHPTQVDNLPILAGIQPAELCRKGAPLSLACRAMEPGHLLHSALTCPPSGNARHLKYRDTHLYPPHNNPSVHLTTTTEMRRSRRITDEMQRGWRTSPDSVLSFTTSAPTLLEWPYQEQHGCVLTASALVSDFFAPAHTYVVWPLLRLASVVQENGPFAMLFFTA